MWPSVVPVCYLSFGEGLGKAMCKGPCLSNVSVEALEVLAGGPAFYLPSADLDGAFLEGSLGSPTLTNASLTNGSIGRVINGKLSGINLTGTAGASLTET